MAGGKISPRQKMINMMYLVLTALLALNVSAEILEAFNQLREALKESAENYQHKNTDTEKAIKAKVQEEIDQKNMKNAWIMEATDEVSKKTMELVAWINNDLVKPLEEIASQDPATKEYTNIKELEANYRLWMIGENGSEHDNGGRGGGKAKIFREKLNGYVTWANDFIRKNDTSGKSTIKFEMIANDPKDDKNFNKESEHINDTWEYYNFHNKPVIADMAMVEKYKTDVYKIQYELLNYLKSKLGAVTFKIDSLIAVDAPMSRVVAAGMKFETKLFVAMSSKDIKPQFTGSGSVVVDPGGTSANMTLSAMGGFAAGKNEKEQSYSARILVPRTDGGTEELKVEGKFTVRKPEVVITSASVQNLYMQCGNTINVDVPALGDFYNPVLTASDAEVITSSEKRKVTIVPRGTVCVLNVKSNTNGQVIDIDNVKYKVIKPPKPSIVLLVDGKEYNGTTPINKKSNCVVALKPDNDFVNALPKDARYAISSIELLAQTSLGAPTKVGGASGSGKDAAKGISVETGSSLKSAVPGTKIYFKIDRISRINFQNKSVEEKFGDRELYIGAVIK